MLLNLPKAAGTLLKHVATPAAKAAHSFYRLYT